MIAHWDDLQPTHEADGTIEFDGYDLGRAAGTLDVGLTRLIALLDHRAYEAREEPTV